MIRHLPLALAALLLVAAGPPQVAPPSVAPGGDASNTTVTATGGTGSQTTAARAGARLMAQDIATFKGDGISDDTATLTTLASKALAGNAVAVINAPLFLAAPQSVNLPSGLQLVFEGTGAISWNFGALTSVQIASPGRAYTGIPTASIAGNATLGAVTMKLYQPTISAGGAGYVVGDVLTLPGGTGTAPTIRVASVSAGVITAVSYVTQGALTVLPSGTISATGGSGSGATFTETWMVSSIAVSSGGAYPSATVPAITLSGGSPLIAASAVAIGQRPTIAGQITASERQIFGGYERVAGYPNSGVLRAAWFGVSTSAVDNTIAIQSAIDSGIAVQFGAGLFQASGVIYPHNNLKMLGTASTGTTDGGYGQFGTQLWGTGTGQAFFLGYSGTANGGLNIHDLAISTAPSSSYNWAVEIPQLASSEWVNYKVQNNWSGAAGGAHFSNENPTTNITQQYSPAWINTFVNGVVGSAGGAPVNSELTDSRFLDLYASGGSGSIEAGLNNSWFNFMADNASSACLTISPKANASASFFTLTGGNLQFCTAAGLAFAPGNGPSPLLSHSVVSGVNFNNSSATTGDVLLTNTEYVTLSGNSFSTNSAANFAASGTVDYITAVGNDVPKGTAALTGAGTHNTLMNSDGVIGGQATQTLRTARGASMVFADPGGTAGVCPFTLTAGLSSAAAGTFAIGCNVGFNLLANNSIQFMISGVGYLVLDSAGTVTAAKPLRLTTSAGLVAAGTTQATALALTSDISAVTTVASGSGVLLKSFVGQRQEVFNRGANALLVYPASGAQIEANAANASVSIPVGGHAVFECVTATQCYQAP